MYGQASLQVRLGGRGGGGGGRPGFTTCAREWWRYCSSTPQNHRAGQLAAQIALGITWGGLVGGRGHRKGQLRVLGRPSARHTKEPRTGGPPGGGAGSPRTRFFLAKAP
jgi:hypothetical protein